MVEAVEPSISTVTVVDPETENGLETKLWVPSLKQNGRPAPLEEELELLDDEELELEDEELEELLLDEELVEPDPPSITNCAQPVSVAPPAGLPMVK
jgi:hypothetical protein